MRVLIAYGTTEGMTGRIAERMGEVARSLGHEVDVHAAESIEAPLPAGRYDAILVGGSVHTGRYQRAVRRFIAGHRDLLTSVHSAFFSVCMSIASRNESERQAARRLAEAFPARLGWHPDATEVFAGALLFTRYPFLTRLLMRFVARREQGKLAADRDYVYTDWGQVERFVREFLGAAQPEWRPPVSPSPGAPPPA